jgi:integrase
MYAGLRHGELRALRVSDIDFAKGLIRVRRGWDDVEGEQAPKTEKAKRDVVLLDPLLPVLRGHIVREGRRGSDLVFGEAPDKPLPSATERRRAQAAWRAENERRARRGEDPLTPLGFHDCRHAFASVLIASNANPLQIQTQMGHASIGETYGTYGHHFRDSVEDLRARANAFLAGDERRALRVVGG